MAASLGLTVWGAGSIAASHRTARLAESLPRMTCDGFLRMGRAAPRFLTLTDVRLCRAGYAFYRDMDAASEMYVPVFSNKLREEPRGADLLLLLEVLDDRERERLLASRDVGQLPVDGLTVELWTDAASLDAWVEAQLSAIYPGLKLAACRVLSVGLHEPSAVRAQREYRDGLVLLILAAMCQLGWWAWTQFVGVCPSGGSDVELPSELAVSHI